MKYLTRGLILTVFIMFLFVGVKLELSIGNNNVCGYINGLSFKYKCNQVTEGK